MINKKQMITRSLYSMVPVQGELNKYRFVNFVVNVVNNDEWLA